MVGPDLMPRAIPRPRPGGSGRPPPDQLGGPADRLLPVAVGRRVAGDEGLALAGEVAQADLQAVDPERAGPLVDVRLHRPVDLRVAEAAEGRGRRRVGEDAPRDDPHRRDAVGPGGRVAALADHPVGDVGVGPDEVVGLDVLEGERAVGAEPGPDADLGGRAPDRLERLLEGQDQADGPARPEGHEGDERLELGVLLAAEAAARVRGEDPDLRERQAEDLRQDLLQPVRVLDGAPDGDPVAVRRGHERVGLDGEVGDHRERVRVLDDEVGPVASTSPQPKRCSRRTFVPASGSFGRSAGSWTRRPPGRGRPRP